MTDEHTLWELAASVEGHNRAQGAEPEPDAPTPEEFEAIIERDRAIIMNRLN